MRSWTRLNSAKMDLVTDVTLFRTFNSNKNNFVNMRSFIAICYTIMKYRTTKFANFYEESGKCVRDAWFVPLLSLRCRKNGTFGSHIFMSLQQILMKLWVHPWGLGLLITWSGADPENSERWGWVPHPPLHFSGDAAHSIVGVFVMQS